MGFFVLRPKLGYNKTMLTTNFWRKYFKVLIRMGAFAFREHGVRRRAFRMHGLCVFNSFKRSY
ncbi:MAG: hypothetical protein COT41_01505 [Candidatus Portnoybacteria bacterium CG08_land_8_20_14_0_20_40_83]|uniref:Uncharacterized protein n=1 Tax=Candidatus Portnoybacteria bacterium CG_4_9_14_3_um_filter_40_10 TaxID=1974804 RepID=A0A2M7YMQ9_9BACT|nr:MAG: hypothetical protein COT41_01505 [Candidatus Portnoybacteria bacterium CG08_land_8_20_14_0_20_40_83]PJA64246.1 MAG: hypothetical protein CO159_04105 [Candidatus Portnoybacteria bacterium CG_4_9_14_3_um_filter_40_10]